jgi:hypothetical protein
MYCSTNSGGCAGADPSVRICARSRLRRQCWQCTARTTLSFRLRLERLYGPNPGAQVLCGCCRRRAEPVLASARVVLRTSPIQSVADPKTFRSGRDFSALAIRAVASLPCSCGAARLIVPAYWRHQAPELKGPSKPSGRFMKPAHLAHGLQSDDGRKQSVICLMATRSERPRPGGYQVTQKVDRDAPL